MTVIPLVVSMLIVGIASTGNAASVGRMGGRGIVVFLTLLTASGLTAALVAPPVLARVSLDPAAVAALRANLATTNAAESAKAIQTPAQWIVSLVPSNPIRSAADGTMLPLIIFALVFGLALLAIEPVLRERAVAFFRGIAESMLVIVRWILALAPIGVFALALPLVARLGLSAIGALAAYVVLVSALAVAFILFVVYPVAAVLGRVSIGAFARAVLPEI